MWISQFCLWLLIMISTTPSKGEDMFQCSAGYSIPIALICDGTNHCGDNADEQDCSEDPMMSITTTEKPALKLRTASEILQVCGKREGERNLTIEQSTGFVTSPHKEAWSTAIMIEDRFG